MLLLVFLDLLDMFLNQLDNYLILDISIFFPGLINSLSEIGLFGDFSLQKVPNGYSDHVLVTLLLAQVLLEHQGHIVLFFVHCVLTTFHTWRGYHDDSFFYIKR